MRTRFLGCLVALGLAAGLQTAGAAPSLSGNVNASPMSRTLPAAHHKCGKGQYWVPAGYAKHGKYRAAHCAPR
jgi:hypothetical protein